MRILRNAILWAVSRLAEWHRPRFVCYEPTGAELIQALRMSRKNER